MALIVLSIIIFQGLIFFGLVFLLRQFMKGNVRGELGHLQQLNDELLKRQSELKEKAESAEREYNEKMNKLEMEITTKQTKLHQDAGKMLEESREKALKEREKIINEAVETREKMRQEIMAEMEDKAILRSKELLAEFYSGNSRHILHGMLIEQLLEGLDAVDLSGYQIEGDSVVVEGAEALSPQQKQKLLGILKTKMGREVKCTETLRKDLIGGIILKVGSFVIDGSMENRLQESAARLKKETRRKYQSTT